MGCCGPEGVTQPVNVSSVVWTWWICFVWSLCASVLPCGVLVWVIEMMHHFMPWMLNALGCITVQKPCHLDGRPSWKWSRLLLLPWQWNSCWNTLMLVRLMNSLDWRNGMHEALSTWICYGMCGQCALRTRCCARSSLREWMMFICVVYSSSCAHDVMYSQTICALYKFAENQWIVLNDLLSDAHRESGECKWRWLRSLDRCGDEYRPHEPSSAHDLAYFGSWLLGVINKAAMG